jgi:hypothetical protein
MEKLEYSRYYARTIMNEFTTVPKVYVLSIILTDLTRFLLSFVCWSFQVLGDITIDEGIRSGKTLSLGMPKAPQGNIQGIPKRLSLVMPRMASPLSSTIHRYVTWSNIFIHHMIWVLLGASCAIVLFCFLVSLPQSLFTGHTFWERHTFIMIC